MPYFRDEEARAIIRDTYGKVRSDSAIVAEMYYDSEELARLPREAVALALGVGHPVRQAALREGETVLDLGCGAGIDTLLAACAVGFEDIRVVERRSVGLEQIATYPLFTPDFLDLLRRVMETQSEVVFSIRYGPQAIVNGLYEHSPEEDGNAQSNHARLDRGPLAGRRNRPRRGTSRGPQDSLRPAGGVVQHRGGRRCPRRPHLRESDAQREPGRRQGA